MQSLTIDELTICIWSQPYLTCLPLYTASAMLNSGCKLLCCKVNSSSVLSSLHLDFHNVESCFYARAKFCVSVGTTLLSMTSIMC